MLRKISFGLLRPEREEGQPARKPLFNRRETAPERPRPPSPLDFSDGPLDQRRASYAVSNEPLRLRMPARNTSYLNSNLEALNLEPLVAPSLAPVESYVISREVAQQERRSSIGPMSPGGIGLLAIPAHPGEQGEFAITPIPRRPVLKRSALSDRGRHKMPLRIQAVRRMHQEAMANALARHMEQVAEERRRSSGSPEEELEEWRERGRQVAAWDDFAALPEAQSPTFEPTSDPFALAFGEAAYRRSAFESYDISPDRTERGSPLPQADVAPDEDPFEFDAIDEYDNGYAPPHTPRRHGTKPPGNFI